MALALALCGTERHCCLQPTCASHHSQQPGEVPSRPSRPSSPLAGHQCHGGWRVGLAWGQADASGCRRCHEVAVPQQPWGTGQCDTAADDTSVLTSVTSPCSSRAEPAGLSSAGCCGAKIEPEVTQPQSGSPGQLLCQAAHTLRSAQPRGHSWWPSPGSALPAFVFHLDLLLSLGGCLPENQRAPGGGEGLQEHRIQPPTQPHPGH